MWDTLTPPSSPAAVRSSFCGWPPAATAGKNAPSFALRPWHCGPRCRWPPISSSRTRNGGIVYYNLRAVLQLVCYGLLAWWYTHSPDPERRSIMKSHRTAFFWAIGLTCGIILENVYVQLIFDPGSIPRGMWVLAERSPMENLLFICYGLAVLRGASVSLQLRARELPEGDDPLLAESIDRLLPLYSRTYDLSKREEEVLRHALMGKDNQNIASTLTLSAGTVKVHMHNILKKTGHANRAELAADFWER